MKKDQKNNTEDIVIKINKKKILKGLGVFLIVAAVLGFAFFASKDTGKVVEFVNITIDEYLERMQKDEKSIIYIARPTCSWCQKETPIVKKLMNQYNLTIYYLNTESFYDSEKQDYTEDGYKLINSSEKYANGFGTPNTIIVSGGNIVDGKFGYAEAKDLEDMLVSNGLIHE